MKTSRQGLTLVELLIAAAILIVALSSILIFFVRTTFLNTENRNLTVAIAHGQYALETLKDTPFASIQSQTWNNVAISARGLAPLLSESIVLTVTGTSLLDVRATVNWMDRGVRNRSITFETLIAEP